VPATGGARSVPAKG